MHAEYLRFVAEQLLNELKSIALMEKWSALISAVEQQIESPSQENAQLVISSRDDIREVLKSSILSRIPTTWKAIIKDLETDYLAAQNLNHQLDSIAAENALSLQDKLKSLQTTKNNIEGDLQAFQEVVDSFDWLKIHPMILPSGEGEVAVYIPRMIFENDLEGLQEELSDLDHLMKTCEEIVTGATPSSSKIRYFSTSDPVFWLYATPGVVFFILKLINMILDAYEKVIRVRKMKAELSQISNSPELNKELDKQVNLFVESGVEELLNFATKRFTSKHQDQGRANELLNALRISATALASKIDNGYRIEARVELTSLSEEEDLEGKKGKRKNLDNLTPSEVEELSKLSEKARHFEPIGEPVLSLPKQKRQAKPRKRQSSAK